MFLVAKFSNNKSSTITIVEWTYSIIQLSKKEYIRYVGLNIRVQPVHHFFNRHSWRLITRQAWQENANRYVLVGVLRNRSRQKNLGIAQEFRRLTLKTSKINPRRVSDEHLWHSLKYLSVIFGSGGRIFRWMKSSLQIVCTFCLVRVCTVYTVSLTTCST